ncbi:MAG: hypothetical protein M1497_02710 [Nitrospirae bacterium]|nr:hypothetical protein [Nitrospirota bacterium]
MSNHKDYTIEIGLKSTLATPLQSDTIFGHICWAIRYLPWGGDKLTEFLSLYDKDEGKNPPLLVSNGFPKGYLPKPILPPVTQDFLDSRFKINRIESSFRIKTIKGLDIIPEETFRQLQQDVLTPACLFDAINERYEEIMSFRKMTTAEMIEHNSVNRLSNRVETGLYSQEETFFDGDASTFNIYMRTWYFDKRDIERIFDFIGRGGFGKDKSTGKGAFDITVKEKIELTEAANPNAFMTLSSFVPKAGDPVDGYYGLCSQIRKTGRLLREEFPGGKRQPV